MILFVDDEKREMDSYVQELELSGYKVVFKKDADVALEFFEKSLNEIDLVILDIMMSPGSSFKQMDTQMGLRTGIAFYKKIREKASELPVLIFTNVSDEKVSETFLKETKCQFLRKENYLPFEVVDEVKKILG